MMLNLQKHFAEEQETHDFLASCLEHRTEVEDFLSSMERMKKEYKGGGGSGGSSTIVIKVDGPRLRNLWLTSRSEQIEKNVEHIGGKINE